MLFTSTRKAAPRIAVIGLGCWYPGARNPRQFWEGILGRRREHRRLPDCRLPLGDYHDPDPTTPDKTYGRRGALLDGFQFDWAGRRIPRAAYEATDVVQWLALEVAEQALADAGCPRETLPRERTAVLVGNTLTGEHTRSQSLRLRWPFVRRALAKAAEAHGLGTEQVDRLAETMEATFKSVFAPVTEDTLAGGLSNTIAGRICNSFDLHGGGYTVDGACSSSLLAVINAANLLHTRDCDLAIAGGVDVSLDTFELIGFAKTGALTKDDMRVYDKRAGGFIPGEGCGFVVLRRLEEARAAGNTVYAVLRGWGVSSDGKGGLTAPSVAGQALALNRAYQRAGYGAGQLDFIEGHGTGTRVGDRVELEAAGRVLEAGGAGPRSCGITSLKSLVGHTKAAAGIGAFIKAVLAVNRRVLPPTAGCEQPSDTFEGPARCLYPIRQGAVRSPGDVLRAGVSAMGFGGINAHVTLESGGEPVARVAPQVEERALLASYQATEVFPFAATSPEALAEQLRALAPTALGLSRGDLTDLAAHLARGVSNAPARAAVVAGTPEELAARCTAVADHLDKNPLRAGGSDADPSGTWWVGYGCQRRRLGFLFPGQGSQQLGMARRLVERFPWARERVAQAERWLAGEVGMPALWSFIDRPVERALTAAERKEWEQELARTEVAQPAICLASLLWVEYLERLGLRPTAVGGHSLGELTAFHRAGAFDAETLLRLAAVRGRAMAAPGGEAGAMAALAVDDRTAAELLAGVPGYAVVANRNAPGQTVVAGEESAITAVLAKAAERGITARRLPVSNAFHTRLMAGAAEVLRSTPLLAGPGPRTARLFSSHSGAEVPALVRPGEHFAEQALAPVDFQGLVEHLAASCDQLIEVGPGRVLSGLADATLEQSGTCLPVAGQPDRDGDLSAVLARAFALGVEVRWHALYEGRLVREFVPADKRLFIDNPCERPLTVPEAEPMVLDAAARVTVSPVKRAERPTPAPAAAPAGSVSAGGNLQELLIDLAVKRTGFPRESITPERKLLDDLNLDSIKAAELVASAAKEVGLAGQIDPAQYANATLGEVAAALQAALPERGAPEAVPAKPAAPAVAAAVPAPVPAGPVWVRAFTIDYVHDAA